MFNIWLIDPDIEFAKTFGKYLENYGFNVQLLKDLSSKIEEERVNVIIFDFNLISTDFFQLLQGLRNQQNNVKIILISDFFSYEIIQLLLDYRLDSFQIEKTNFRNLLEKINKLIFSNKISLKNNSFEVSIDSAKEKILKNIFFLDNYIDELKINYYSILKLKIYLESKSYLNIVLVLEDFNEILITLSRTQTNIIINQIFEILNGLNLIQEIDDSLRLRITYLILYYEIYSEFIDVKIYEILPKCLMIYDYYLRVKNGPMIIKTISILVASYTFAGLYDKSTQLISDFFNYHFINKQVHALHKKYLYLILKHYNKIMVFINNSKYYDNGIFTSVSLNDFLFQNKFFLDQAFLNTKLIYTNYFGSLNDVLELATNIYSELLNNPINYINNNYILVIDSLINYFILKGENIKGKHLLDSSLNFFNYYKKEFDLHPLNAYNAYFLRNNEEIDIAFLIFQNYKNILLNHYKNSMIFQNLFLEYLNFLLLSGDYSKFTTLFKNLLADYSHFGIKGSYLFFLFEPMIHYSIIKSVLIFDLITPNLFIQNNINENSFSFISSKLMELISKINEQGITKNSLDKFLSLFYQSIEFNQLYLSKCIIIFNLELMINLFIEKTELGVYFIQIANDYEHYIDFFKEFKLYHNYIKCLIFIIKNFSLQDKMLNSDINYFLYYFKKKKIKFFSDNIEKYISRTANSFIFTSIDQLKREPNLDMSYFYNPLTNLYKIANKLKIGFLEASIIIVINKFQNMTRSQIALELALNQSSIRYTLNKLLEDKLIDYENIKKTTSKIKKSSHRYYLTDKGKKLLFEIYKLKEQN